MAPKGLVQGAKAPSPALLANEIIYSLITKSPSQSSAGRRIFVCPQERTFASITPPTKPFTRNTSTAPAPNFLRKEAAEDPTPGNESLFRITVPVLQGTFRRAYATCLPGVYPDRPSEERQAIPQTPIMNAPDALFLVSAFRAFWRKARNKMRHSFYDVSFPYKRYHDTLLIVTHDNARSFRMRLQQFDCTLFHKSKRGYAR